MSEKEFVDKLKETPFSREEYSSIGLDEEFINETLKAYNPPAKTSSIDHLYVDDPLIRLVENYDMLHTEIGMVWFGGEIVETEDFYRVGKFEADLLCISKLSGEVVVLSFDSLGVAYNCARDSARFLDVMIVAAKFLEKCGLEDNLYTNQGAICAMAEYCSDLSGGSKYSNFYKVLLGCES